MSLIVTGISPDGDVEPLSKAIAAAGFSLDPLSAIAAGDEPVALESRGLASGGAAGVGDLPTGTAVPGLTSARGLDPGPLIFHGSIIDRLGDLEIPDDELENYIEAVEEGRTVVAYYARTENVDAVESIFRAAGLARIKRF